MCSRVCHRNTSAKASASSTPEPAVAIGRLERFVADTYIATSACEQVTGTNSCAMPVKGKKVACIGSGPSSLTCAGVCAANGLKVDVFEALHEPGGVLIYGIPSFRLPKNVVATEVDGLRRSGVDFHLNSVGGRTFTVDELRKEYDAVFIGVGAGLPVFLGVPGENLVGVFSANEYLTRVNLGRALCLPEQGHPRLPRQACDRIRRRQRGHGRRPHRPAHGRGKRAHRLPPHQGRDARPPRGSGTCGGRGREVRDAGRPRAVQRGRRDEAHVRDPAEDGTGRARRLRPPRRPVPVEGATYELATDLAIVALGTRSNPILLERLHRRPGKDRTRLHPRWMKPRARTSLPNVFAGGDIVGAATVILAMGAGRRAGQEICRRLLG